MTGWKTTKHVIDLKDKIIIELEAVTPQIRRHAWYWISFYMYVEHELEEKTSLVSDDETIDWLKQHPDRLAKHIEVMTNLHNSLQRREEETRLYLKRLHK